MWAAAKDEVPQLVRVRLQGGWVRNGIKVYWLCGKYMLPATKSGNHKKWDFFHFTMLLLAKSSYLHPPPPWRLLTTVAASQHYLPCLPWQKWQWMVLADCCMPLHRVEGTKAAMGQRRLPWLKSVSGAHFVSVLHVCLRGHHHRWSWK